MEWKCAKQRRCTSECGECAVQVVVLLTHRGIGVVCSAFANRRVLVTVSGVIASALLYGVGGGDGTGGCWS